MARRSGGRLGGHRDPGLPAAFQQRVPAGLAVVDGGDQEGTLGERAVMPGTLGRAEAVDDGAGGLVAADRLAGGVVRAGDEDFPAGEINAELHGLYLVSWHSADRTGMVGPIRTGC